MIFLTRKAEFSSAHYYWNDAWSPEENQRVFGKCANRNGHGHNYTLEVTVAGERRSHLRLRRRSERVEGHPRARSRQRLRPPASQPRSSRVQDHDSHDREHRHRNLAPARQQDSSCKAASRPRLRDARSIRRLLW